MRTAPDANFHVHHQFGWWAHPLYYLIWTVILPQPYESAWLRFASGISFIPFFFYKHYSVRFAPWLNLYWYLCLTFALPVIFTFLMLMNDLSGMWLVCETMMFLVFILAIPNFFLMMFFLIVGFLKNPSVARVRVKRLVL